jgi:SAM-dependent methyltransferase
MTVTSDRFKADAWDMSYSKGDNYVFYPHEEVIRFVSRYIRKRTGLTTFRDQRDFASTPRGLDLGCGIGRHVRFIDDMNMDAYGIDLSRVAIEEALNICKAERRDHLANRFHIGSITDMPYDNAYFDFIVSHGVLDSLPLELAKEAISEAKRILKPGGLFYLDLVSGDDSAHYPEYSGEETVTGPFESNTIQSYFNLDRIYDLINGHFEMIDCTLIKHKNVIGNSWHSRYHLALSS